MGAVAINIVAVVLCGLAAGLCAAFGDYRMAVMNAALAVLNLAVIGITARLP